MDDDTNLGSEFFLRPLTPLWLLIASSKPGGRVEETELVAGEAAAWEVSLGGGGGRGGIGGAPLGKGFQEMVSFLTSFQLARVLLLEQCVLGVVLAHL